MLGAICRYLFILFILTPVVQAAGFDQSFPQAQDFFPNAVRFGEPEGNPLAAPVYQGQELIGHVFQTNDVLKINAYSGKPINMLVGIDSKGIITGVQVLEHHEPILLVGIQEQDLTDFVNQYPGKSITDRIRVGGSQREGRVGIDAITGATVTVMVMNEVITRSARKVFQTRETQKPPAVTVAPATVRTNVFQPTGWTELVANQAIRRLHLNRSQVDQAFQGTEGEGVDTASPEQLNDTFIDLYYTYLNVPSIGRNLLGESQYQWLMSELKPGQHAIAILANGIYSFKGFSYVRGGIFDHVQLQQNNQAISFRDLDYHRLSDVYADGMPRFKEMAIFIVQDRYAFDPTRPWQLELLVRRQTGPLDSVFTNFTGDYQLPDTYLNAPPPPTSEAAMPEPSVETAAAASASAETNAEPIQAGTEPAQIQAKPAEVMLEDEELEPIWIQVWRGRVFQVVCLGIGLLLLTSILIFQDWLTRRPWLLNPLRIGFLLYTVVFIGWYTLAQLSVVNVLTFIGAIVHDFKWDTFLLDPMIFILWSFVAMTLLLWGRGVYCGWLCPFGAIQELVNKLARRLKVRQLELPFVVHERLWALKYLILLGLFGISLQSLVDAERAAEIEPFKTAITLHFQREWGYVLYAGMLIAISVFNRKFYCRYLCPLGAALAIPARIRLFDWLKRHKECGSPCQICANECEVQAVHPSGEINANECHYCLDCQMTYFNDHKCPPVIAKRKRREKASTARASVARMEKTLGTSAGLDKIRVKVEPKQPSSKE